MKKFVCALMLGVLASAGLCRAGNLRDGLILYYNFSLALGAVVPDMSGHRHPGAMQNGAKTVPGGVCGRAAQFDGVNDIVAAGNLGYQPKGTISFWMNADSLDGHRAALSTYPIWDQDLRFEGDATGAFAVGLGPILGGRLLMSDMKPHTWYQVTFAWTTNSFTGWLNGQKVFTGTHDNQLFLNFSSVTVGNGYSTEPERYWMGLIDEVRIYNRVLSDAEVSSLYTARP